MDDIEKMMQQKAALDAKIAEAITARKKAWQTGSEKRLAMVGAWLLAERKIALDGGLDEMPTQFVATLTAKQKAVWAKPWEKKAAPKAQEAAKPATPAPTIPEVPKEAPAPRIAAENTKLNLSYADKEAGKALGARFDADGRFWYVPAGQDLTPFERWLA